MLQRCLWSVLVLALGLTLLAAACDDSSNDDDDDDNDASPGGDDDDDTSPAGEDDDNDASPADDDNDDNDSSPGDDDDNDDNDDDTSPGEWWTIQAGNLTVRIFTYPYYLEVLNPDQEIILATPVYGKGLNLSPLTFAPHAFQTGNLFGDWYAARRALTLAEDDDGATVAIQAADVATGEAAGTITLVIRAEDDNHLTMTTTNAGVEDANYQVGAYQLDADEHFFGLGWQKDAIDQRGKLRTMFTGLGLDLTDQIQNHAPIPFLISSRGYGLFVEDRGHGEFDMGDGDAYAWGYKYRTAELKTHVFWGPAPLDIIEAYTGVTGRPPLNPDYLFGYLHWRNVNDSETEIYDDADGLRAQGIPSSAILVDAPWQSAYQTMEFNECPTGCQFVDAQAVIDYCHQKGYAFYLWTAEFMNRVSPIEVPGMIEDNSELFNYAKENDYLISILGFLYEIPWWHDNGAIINFLNPDAYDWFQGLVRNVMEMGVQGFKMDGGEYVGADTIGLWPVGAFDLEGYGEANTSHHEFRWAYHDLFWELAQEYNEVPDETNRGISTVRCAVWGEQSHINYFWPGDMESNWGTELGLPAEIIGGLNLSTAGFPYYGANNGGFSDYGTDQPELLARWTEYSALRPIFEGPSGGTHQVWEVYPEWVLDIYRTYTILHTRLFPYLKAYAAQAHEKGHPIMRMLPLHYLDDPATYSSDFEYLLGDWLLVAPVYAESATSREVYLPADTWIDYWTNEVIEGPQTLTAEAPIEIIPLYAKAGAIIPMLDPAVQTLWPTDDPDIIDHQDLAGLMWVDIYPDYFGTELTLADGTIFDLAARSGLGGFLFTIAAPHKDSRTYSIRAVTASYGGGKPSAVTGPSGTLIEYETYEAWDAAAAGWFYDEALGDLWLRDTCAGCTFDVQQ